MTGQKGVKDRLKRGAKIGTKRKPRQVQKWDQDRPKKWVKTGQKRGL